MTEPTLVVWILYDATADKKYIKMDPTNGSLAIFDSEEAAIAAKKLHCGTDYKRCEYYSAPQPDPDVSGLAEIAREIVKLHDKRKVVLTVHVEALKEVLADSQQSSTKCPGAGCTDQGCPAHYAIPQPTVQPAPEVAKLAEALEGLLGIIGDSYGVHGYHTNGDVAEWDEFEEVEMAEEALAIYRQQGEDL